MEDFFGARLTPTCHHNNWKSKCSKKMASMMGYPGEKNQRAAILHSEFLAKLFPPGNKKGNGL